MRRKTEATVEPIPEVEATFSASPARPRRKRNSPAAAPIDGDRRMDQVLNQNTPRNRDWQPLLLTDEDFELSWSQWGAVKETRGPDSMRPAVNVGGEGGSDYRVKGLTLYKVRKSVFEARNQRAQKESTDRMAVMGREARRTVGGEFIESHV